MVRRERLWPLLTLVLLNIFALTAALTVRDIIAFRPADPPEPPLVRAEEAAARPQPDSAAFDEDGLAELFDEYLDDVGLEDGFSAYVVDTATEEPVYAVAEETPAVPASTIKIATAVAALHAVGPDERISTRVVTGSSPDEIVLVGGGDPTLTDAAESGSYPRLASLEELAERTAEALREAGLDSVTLGYDDSGYSGPTMGPEWKTGYVTGGSTAEVHALMHERGRVDPSHRYGPRHSDPPQVTAEAFAARLDGAGISVAEDPAPQEAEDSARELASVESASVAALVEIMMVESDNNVAEALSRQVALARGEDPSFEGAAAAAGEVLAELGISGVRIADGSGLSVENEATAQALAEMLLLAADPEQPDLHPTLTGLPVARFTGTLSERYSEHGSASAGAGVVRGKTGTLDGVSTLAGHVHGAEGRLLVFAFMANDPSAQGSTLDVLAALAAECKC